MATLEQYQQTQARANDLLKNASDNYWQLTDYIIEVANEYPDQWLDFFTGGAYGKHERTINIMRLVGLRFPPHARVYDCGFSYYREVYSERHTDDIVHTLLTDAAAGVYENRDQFRADRDDKLNIKPAQTLRDSCKSQNLASALERLIPAGVDVEITKRGDTIRLKIVRQEAMV